VKMKIKEASPTPSQGGVKKSGLILTPVFKTINLLNL